MRSARLRSSWLDDRIDEQRTDLQQRAGAFSLASRISFAVFVVCCSAAFAWPLAVNGTVQTIGFWGAIVAGAVAVITWNRARIHRSLLDIPLEY